MHCKSVYQITVYNEMLDLLCAAAAVRKAKERKRKYQNGYCRSISCVLRTL